MKHAMVLLVLALATAGCDGLISPSHYGAVRVEAVSTTGTPAPGVDVELYTGLRSMGYGRTDANGIMQFDPVPEGPAYGVYAAAPAGWAFPELIYGGPPTNIIAGFPVRRDSVEVIRFTLVKLGRGSIHTLVQDDAGNTLPGVLVTLYTGTGLVSVLPTDGAGRIAFTDVPAGEYGVSAERPAAYRDIFAEERVYSAPHRIVAEGDSLAATLTFTRVVAPSASR